MDRPPPFLTTRNGDVHVVYRIPVPPPIAVHWASGSQTLLIAVASYPPHFSLCLDSNVSGPGVGHLFTLQSVEHGTIILREGFRVRRRGVLDTFCDRLRREGRADVLAGPHCDVSWSTHVSKEIDLRHPSSRLDAFWTWQQWPHATPTATLEGVAKR